MDMCYDGALVLPSSYAVMNEEEMTYMEGGISVSKYSSGKLFDTYRVHFTAAECSKIALAYGVNIWCSVNYRSFDRSNRSNSWRSYSRSLWNCSSRLELCSIERWIKHIYSNIKIWKII